MGGPTLHDQYFPTYFSTEPSSVNPTHVAQDSHELSGHVAQKNWEASDGHLYFNDDTFGTQVNTHFIATGGSQVPKQTWPWWVRFDIRADIGACCAPSAQFWLNGQSLGQTSPTTANPAQWVTRAMKAGSFTPTTPSQVTWKHTSGASNVSLKSVNVARGDNSGWADPTVALHKDQYQRWWGDQEAVATDGSGTAQQRDPQSGAFYDTGEFAEHDIHEIPVAQTFGFMARDAINPTGTQSDPVNSATGAFVTSATDLRLPGIGIPFDFTRSYTSLDGSVGALGRGWRHSYEAKLDVAGNGDVVLVSETGQQVFFEKRPNGSFVGDPGTLSELSLDGGVYTLDRMDQTTLMFDSSGKLTGIKDGNGNQLGFAYTGGNLTTITDTAGRLIDLTYSSGRLTGAELPDGRSVGFGYTGGLLTTVTDTRGGTTSYTYDVGGRLESVEDQDDHTIATNDYNDAGRVVSQIDGEGQASTFSWNPATQTSTMTDARGKAWKDVYSGLVLIKRVDPLNNETVFERDKRLDLVSVTDARGNETTMTYDSSHNLDTRTAPAPLSYVESFDYDSANRLTSYTDGRNKTTTFNYDGAGNLTLITRPGANETDFTRDPATGLVTQIEDARGKTTVFDHDADGNIVEITSPLGHKTTMAYDDSGRMTSVVEARGNAPGELPANFTTTLDYDESDHLVSVIDPLGNSTEWDYSLDGRLLGQTDAKDRSTTYGYDDAHRLLSVTAPGSIVTSYAYDGSGNLTSRTDAKSHVTAYSYDDAGRLAEVTGPGSRVWSYTYDPAGNLATMIDARGNATAGNPNDFKAVYSYDVLDRLTGIDYSDSTPDVGFDYDANGNRTEMSDGAGAETRIYDDLNRLTEVSRGSSSFDYTYDAAGNVTSRTYPDGTLVQYGYDDDSRMESVTSAGKTTSYTYDPAGRLLTTTLPATNGVIETRTYDRAGRLSQIASLKGAIPIASAAYQRDAVGNPTRMTTLTGITTYTYDSLDRLTGVCLALPCLGVGDPDKISYGYDQVGNRTSEQRSTGTTTYTYNAADELVSSSGPGGSVTYNHDANGNLTSDGTRTYTYDLANRMSSASVGPQTTTYSYDGTGKRLSSVAATTTEYTWDANGGLPQLVRESGGGGALLRRYLHGNDLVSMETPAASSYYHHDGIGSVVATTSESGLPQRTYSYEPFGKEHLSLPLDPNAPANYMRFTGELFDEATGLYHLRARQYDPGLGRFTARDPWPAFPKSPAISLYTYANASPTIFTDPSGLCPLCGTFSELSTIYSAVNTLTRTLILAQTALDITGYGGLARVAAVSSAMSSVMGLATLAAFEVAYAGGADCQVYAAAKGVLMSGVSSLAVALLPAPGIHLAASGRALLQGTRLAGSASALLGSLASDLDLSSCPEPPGGGLGTSLTK